MADSALCGTTALAGATTVALHHLPDKKVVPDISAPIAPCSLSLMLNVISVLPRIADCSEPSLDN
jgi:hypothetical protein